MRVGRLISFLSTAQGTRVPLGIIFFPLSIAAFWVVGFRFLMQLVSAALLLTPVLKSRAVPLFAPPPARGLWDRRF